jgi:hypothetical protein
VCVCVCVCREWVTTGLCPQEQKGETCSFKHELVPMCDLPASYRWFLKKVYICSVCVCVCVCFVCVCVLFE